jgi:hypothetical protein
MYFATASDRLIQYMFLFCSYRKGKWLANPSGMSEQKLLAVNQRTLGNLGSNPENHTEVFGNAAVSGRFFLWIVARCCFSVTSLARVIG